jgi:hypothetical protein
VPALFRCPKCNAGFAFSPGLAGNPVRCRRCDHTFVAPASAEAPEAAGPKPAPPPLPPKPATAPAADDRPPVRLPDRDDPPRGPRRPRRPARPPEPAGRSGGAGLLIALVAVFGIGFLAIAGGIAYLLWPSSNPTPTLAQAEPPAPAPIAPAPAESAPVVERPGPPPVFNVPERPAEVAPPRVKIEPPAPHPAAPPARPEKPPPTPTPAVTAPRWHPVTAFPITPAPVKQDRSEVRLLSSVGDVCVGGGGRFLLVSLPQAKQVAVFDASQAKVVKYLAVAGDTPRIAASMDKLFVADRSTGVIQRFSLRTFEKELTVPLPALPGQAQVDALVTGSGAAGPILVGVTEREKGGGSALFLDPVTLKEVTPDLGDGRRFPGLTPYLARASADGRTFVIHDGHGGEPHALKVITFVGSTAKLSGEVWPAPASIGVPNGDGSLIYTGHGIYTPDLKGAGADSRVNALPARHGAFAIRLQPAGESSAPKVKGKAAPGSTVTFHLARDDRPLAKLDNVEGVHHEGVAYGSSQDRINHDKRVHWVPDAKLLVTVPDTNDRLCLYRIDLEQAMAKSDIDYLYVASNPPPVAVKGSTYTYPIVVKSKKGGAKVKLESSPAGMKVGSDLKLTWDVPADFDQADVNVLLTVSDETGQEIFHSFRVAVRARGEVPD